MIVAQLVWGFLSQFILGVAQNSGGDLLKFRLGNWLEKATVKRKVTDAITQVLTAFLQRSDNPNLIQHLAADPSFGRDETIAAILADAAYHPVKDAEQISRLAQALQRHTCVAGGFAYADHP